MSTEPVAPAFDALLAITVLVVAWQSLRGRDLFRSIVVFLGFGALLAVVWARLDAPDLALAEAAIGAGLTGALFLKAAHRLREDDHGAGEGLAGSAAGRRAWMVLTTAFAVPMAAVVGYAILSLPAEAPGLRPLVGAKLESSGVVNPVTAVLLNFRAYDTVLEIGVLLAAGLACWTGPSATTWPRTPEPHLRLLVRFLTPLLLVTAGYLLWAGSTLPGGAFQAGALLAGGGVLRLLLGEAPVAAGGGGRALAVLGLAVFLGIGAGVLVVRPAFLQLPEGHAGSLILAIEAACTISVGYLLVLMYQGGRARSP
jgi:multisubunit Na+/H+ antiporter MnhB subunit